jgi:hypothetical protein
MMQGGRDKGNGDVLARLRQTVLRRSRSCPLLARTRPTIHGGGYLLIEVKWKANAAGMFVAGES